MAQAARAAAAHFRHLHLNNFVPFQIATAIATATAVPNQISIFKLSVHRRHGHFQSRGLRQPRELPLEDEAAAGENKLRKSRNDMKREARQSVRWGMELASFTTPQIKLILKAASLEPEVFEALMVVKRLGPDVREGKRRQYNYIGKLLRDAQPDVLESLIQATKEGDHSTLQALAGSTESVDEDPEEQFHESENEVELEGDHIILAKKWYDGLIDKDIQKSNEVYSIDEVEFDRQELRRLVRKVHIMQERQSVEDTIVGLRDAEKSLSRFLCFLAKQMLALNSQSA